MAIKIVKAANSLLNFFVTLFLCIAGLYAGYALWDNNQVYAAAQNVQADMIKLKPVLSEDGEDGASFEELLAINKDVCAWVTVDNTDIDFPILQGETNLSYINTDVYGNFALAGSIFLDSRNAPYFTDQYNLVHGHHMAERRMFGDLDLYKDQKFFEENRTGVLILEDKTYSLRTFSALYVLSYDKVIFQPNKWINDLKEPLEYAKEISLYKDDEMIDRLYKENEEAKVGGKKPQIILLATCSPESDDSRFVLLAEMIPLEASKNGEVEP